MNNSFLYLCPATYSSSLCTDIGRILPEGVRGNFITDRELENSAHLQNKGSKVDGGDECSLSEMCYCWSQRDISVLYMFRALRK